MTKTDTLWNNFNDWMDDYPCNAIKVVVWYRTGDGLKTDIEYFDALDLDAINEYVRRELWTHIDYAEYIEIRQYDNEHDYHLIKFIEAD